MSIFQNGAYINGFDYPNATNQIFDSGSGALSTTTRFGSGHSLNAGGTKNVKGLQAQVGTLFDGFAVAESDLPGSGWAPMRQWIDSTTGTVQVSLQYNAQGAVAFFRGSGTGTPLGSASPNGVISPNLFTFIELKIVFATGTGGSVELKVWGPNGNNSTAVISSGSLNTAPSGNAWTDQVAFQTSGVGANNAWFDDWYMLDNTGSAPANTYLGNGRVQTDAATSDASPNQFSSS